MKLFVYNIIEIIIVKLNEKQNKKLFLKILQKTLVKKIFLVYDTKTESTKTKCEFQINEY